MHCYRDHPAVGAWSPIKIRALYRKSYTSPRSHASAPLATPRAPLNGFTPAGEEEGTEEGQELLKAEEDAKAGAAGRGRGLDQVSVSVTGTIANESKDRPSLAVGKDNWGRRFSKVRCSSLLCPHGGTLGA